MVEVRVLHSNALDEVGLDHGPGWLPLHAENVLLLQVLGLKSGGGVDERQGKNADKVLWKRGSADGGRVRELGWKEFGELAEQKVETDYGKGLIR